MPKDIPIIGAAKPVEQVDDNPHRIAVIFPDDHSIEGMRVEAIGITAEQIYIAVMHLHRIAMMALAQRDAMAQRAEQEAIAVRAQLQRERQKGN